MIVCVCKAVNEHAIRRAVAEGHDTFDALQLELGVGTCCGKCVASACAVLCEARAETVEEQSVSRVTNGRREVVQPIHFSTRSPSRETALA
jgi:bacterioferritin-associated ferredoxin